MKPVLNERVLAWQAAASRATSYKDQHDEIIRLAEQSLQDHADLAKAVSPCSSHATSGADVEHVLVRNGRRSL